MTQTKTIAIHKTEFEISAPYAEGHVLTAFEAKALNQTRAENIANSFRKLVASALAGEEGAKSLDEVRADLAAYDAAYAFTAGASTGARSTMTPLEKEARKVARNWLATQLKAANITAKAYKDQHGDDYVEAKIEEVAATAEIQALAKKNLSAAEKAADALSVAL